MEFIQKFPLITQGCFGETEGIYSPTVQFVQTQQGSKKVYMPMAESQVIMLCDFIEQDSEDAPEVAS